MILHLKTENLKNHTPSRGTFQNIAHIREYPLPFPGPKVIGWWFSRHNLWGKQYFVEVAIPLGVETGLLNKAFSSDNNEVYCQGERMKN